MILEIESSYGDLLIHGKNITEVELRAAVKELLTLVNEEEFPSAFCLRHNFEPLPYDSDTQVDFTIDLDTHWVIKH